MLYFVKHFLASIEIIIWFLSFLLLMWCIVLIDLWILNHTCNPGINPLDHGEWFFNVFLNSICLYFVEDFVIYAHQKYWPVVFFISGVFIWFWYRGDIVIKWIWKFSYFFYTLELFDKNRCHSFFMFGWFILHILLFEQVLGRRSVVRYGPLLSPRYPQLRWTGISLVENSSSIISLSLWSLR